MNVRRGRRTVRERHYLLVPKGIEEKRIPSLIGRTVVWESPKGKRIKGKITSLHGNKGVLRAIFERGLPGEALGTKVRIL
ncbi:MAG TPA: 50S ribosomal protein L35ae [Euryarchaeota archaeon]|nr:MAG: 50S ribosomal protein L35ae [Thermococci archaeon]RLF96305.1 MAG: 50S ribosomal protein L35ae [Thermococci archaeon]HDI10475.1 50S ribosomal protein L35ae [Euryarchaeota archaeon]